MTATARSLFFAFWLVVLVPAPAVQAQKINRPLRVATRVVPPFVTQEGGRFGGFSIDLWEEIAGDLGIQSTLTAYPTVTDLLEALRTGKADVAVAAISITAERDRRFDFSQPIFQSGLQIMVRSDGSGGSAAPGFLALLTAPAMRQLVGIILLLILIPAHIVWFLERGREGGMIPDRRYFPGIFTACWWSASTLATQAEEMPKSPVARFVAVLWMFTSVVFVAYFTATVTTSLTVQQLQGSIRGPEDLPGKQVATLRGSTAAAYLREQRSQLLEFNTLEETYQALLKGEADAVVYDAPILLYYAARDGKGRVQLAGPIFRKESYGIAFPQQSPYRKPINVELLRLGETGQYQALYDKWFGDK